MDGILEEQAHRRAFDSVSPLAGAALGPKWKGADSDWEAVSRVVEWALVLFAEVDNGTIPIDVARSLRDDINAGEVGGLLEEVRVTIEEQDEITGTLDSGEQFQLGDRISIQGQVTLRNGLPLVLVGPYNINKLTPQPTP